MQAVTSKRGRGAESAPRTESSAVNGSSDAVVALHASEIVSTEAPGGPSTSQTIMVSSLQQLLQRLPPDSRPAAYKVAVMDENVLGKSTLSGREWAFRQLRR